MTRDSEFGRRACRKYEALLEDYLNGELVRADQKAVTDHWQDCPACRALLKDAFLSTRLLRAAVPSPDPSPGFVGRVMTRIRAAENERITLRANFWQSFVSFGWRFTATAALALIALVSYRVRSGHGAQPNVVAARPTEGIDIFAPEPATVPANDEVLMMVDDGGHEKH
jgi:anti-sigma-K factor RskA